MNQHIRTIGILGAGAVGSYLVMALSGKFKKKPLDHRKRRTKRTSGEKRPEYQ